MSFLQEDEIERLRRVAHMGFPSLPGHSSVNPFNTKSLQCLHTQKISIKTTSYSVHHEMLENSMTQQREIFIAPAAIFPYMIGRTIPLSTQ